VPADLDLLLLTQGLDDHAHPETLQLLPRSLPVVGSLSAAAKVRSLGFEVVTALRPGEHCRHGELQITATAGAPVPQVENGYLLEHPDGSLYLEPHGYLSPDLPARPLDAVITPVVDLGLPVAGAFVSWSNRVAPVAGALQPAHGAGQHRRRRRAVQRPVSRACSG